MFLILDYNQLSNKIHKRYDRINEYMDKLNETIDMFRNIMGGTHNPGYLKECCVQSNLISNSFMIKQYCNMIINNIQNFNKFLYDIEKYYPEEEQEEEEEDMKDKEKNIEVVVEGNV
jgi:hypothetical protein